MKLKEIKNELKTLQGFEKDIRKEMEPYNAELGNISERRSLLIAAWQKRCKHKKTEEYCHYSSGGYDYSESSSYKRQCLSCGIVEEGTYVERPQRSLMLTPPTWSQYTYPNLNMHPPSDKCFHGKEGRSYYFNPPATAEVVKYK